jgi:hypothetical protein
MQISLISIVLLVILTVLGLFTLILSRKYKLPEPIILFVLGVFAQPYITIIDLKPVLIICLILLLFDAGSRFIPHKFDNHSLVMCEFIISSIAVNSAIIGIVLHLFFFKAISLTTIFASLLIGTLMTACSQFEILKFFRIKNNSYYKITELEDHLSNPIVLAFSILLLLMIQAWNLSGNYIDLLKVFGTIFLDIATGVFIGLFMLYASVKIFNRKHKSILAIFFSLLVYYVSGIYQGNGFFAVIVMSLFFHSTVSKTPDMDEFTPILRDLVYVLVFLIMGYTVKINSYILLLSCVFLAVYLLVRDIMLHLVMRKNLNFLIFDCPKGLAVGALVAYALLDIGMVNISYFNYLFHALILFFTFTILISYFANILTKDIIAD